MGYCLEPLVDPSALEGRVEAFITDSGSDTLTGPRRFGRSQLVRFVRDVAERGGRRIWMPGTDIHEPDMIIFDHWSEMEAASSVISENPEADVLYGQDLCHQVPAVVRYRRTKL